MRRNFIPRLATRNLEYNGISTELPAIFSSLFSSSSRTGGAKGLKRGGGTRGGQAEILTEKSWTSTRRGEGDGGPSIGFYRRTLPHCISDSTSDPALDLVLCRN